MRIYLLVFAPLVAFGQNYRTWDNGHASDDWSQRNNWSNNNLPSNSNEVARFSNGNASTSSIDINNNQRTGGMLFDANLTIDITFTRASSELSIRNRSGAAYTIVNNSDQTITFENQMGIEKSMTWQSNHASGGGFNFDAEIDTDGYDLTLQATNAANFFNVSGPIIDSGGLIKTGAGTATLSGNNTHSGGTTVSAGILALGHDNAAGSGDLTFDGGTVVATGGSRSIGTDVNANNTIKIGGTEDIDFTGAFELGGGNREINVTNTGTTTISGSLNNNYYANTTKSGSGTLVLSGNNSGYDGPMLLTGGTLQLENSNALGSSTSGNSIAAGTTLALNHASGMTISEGSFTLSGTGDGGNGAIRNIGGDNTLNATLNFTGATTIQSDADSLTLGTLSPSGHTITLAGAGDIISAGVNSGATVNIVDAGDRGFTGSINTTTLNLQGTGTTTLSGSSGNNITTANIDSGTLILNKSSNFALTGTVNIGDGTGTDTVQFSGSNQMAIGTTVNLASSGVLNLNGSNQSLDQIAGSGQIQLGSGNLTLGEYSGSSSYGGAISGSGGTLTKLNSGTLTLSGNNTFTGATTVSGGTLVAASDTALGTTAAGTSVATNATLELQGGINIGAEALSVTGTGKLLNTSGTNTYGGAISGTGLVTTTGGNLTLSNTNSYSGDTTVGSGTTLTLSADNALGSGSTTVDSGGTLALTGNLTAGQSDFTLAGTGNGSAGAIQNLSGTNRLTGDFSLTAATTTQSDAGTLILGSNPPFEDYATDTFSLGSNALTVDGSGHTTINAGLSGSGDLVKTGTGTLTVGGVVNKAVTSAFTGEVIINDGTLVQASLYNDAPSYVGGYDDFGINNDITIGNGDATAATLTLGTNDSGAGTDFNHLIAGGVDLTVNADGTLNTRGFATFIDDITLDNGTINANKLAGGNADALVITGNISATNTSGDSTINGVIDLNDASLTPTPKTIDVAGGGTLAINARVENGGISKTGEGTLVLSGLNSYGGATNVTNGIVIADQSTSGSFSSLGSATGGTSVSGDGQLQLDGVTIENETLTLNGTGVAANGALQTTAASGANTWTGQVNIAGTSEIEVSASSSLTLTGVVSGSGKTLTIDGPGHSTLTGVTTLSTLNKTGAGNLTLSGSAKNIGTANVSAGTLTLGTSNLLPTASGLGTTDLNLSGTGTFAMAGGINNQIDQLNVSGNSVLDVDGILTLNGGTLSGGDGSGSTGTMILTAGNTLNITNDFTFGNIAETGPGTGLYAGSAGTLELTAGTTLVLSGASTFNLGTLNVTGDTVIDFTGADANNFNIGTLNIADGVTIDVIGWDQYYDLWTAANFVGATLDESNATTAQITFNGFSPADTIWLTDDFGKNEITVPEPGTYGALLIGASLTLWTLRRKRRARVMD